MKRTTLFLVGLLSLLVLACSKGVDEPTPSVANQSLEAEVSSLDLFRAQFSASLAKGVSQFNTLRGQALDEKEEEIYSRRSISELREFSETFRKNLQEIISSVSSRGDSLSTEDIAHLDISYVEKELLVVASEVTDMIREQAFSLEELEGSRSVRAKLALCHEAFVAGVEGAAEDYLIGLVEWTAGGAVGGAAGAGIGFFLGNTWELFKFLRKVDRLEDERDRCQRAARL